jgi:hypothetical protein
MITIRNTNKAGGIVIPGPCMGAKGGCILHPGEECAILEDRAKDICGHGISVVDPHSGLPVDVELEAAEIKIKRHRRNRTIPTATE